MKNKLLKVLSLSAMLLSYNNAAQAKEYSYCREYTKDVKVGTKTQTAYGTACQEIDGTWRIIATDDNLNFDEEVAEIEQQPIQVVDNHAYISHRPYPIFTFFGPRFSFFNFRPQYQKNYYRPNHYRHKYYNRGYGHKKHWKEPRRHRNRGFNQRRNSSISIVL